MRKLTLATCASLAVLGVVGLLTAQGAIAYNDPGCDGKSLTKGIYGWDIAFLTSSDREGNLV